MTTLPASASAVDGHAPAIVIPGGPCRDPAYLEGLAGLACERPLAIAHVRGAPGTPGLSRGWWRDASDIASLADELGLERVDLLAHSAGCRMALAFAVQFPARLRSLLLVTPPATWLTGTADDGEQIGRARHEKAVDRAIESLLGPPPSDEESFQAAIVREAPAGYAHWTERERAHAAVGAVHFDAARAFFRDIPPQAAGLIRSAELPATLVIGGEQDMMTGRSPVVQLARLLGAELSLLPDCGHYPWVEQPELFRAAAAAWLTGTLESRG